MKVTIKKRTLVRLITFFTAGLLILTALLITSFYNAKQARQQLNTLYMKSLSELAQSTGSIKNTLSKTIYSGTPKQLTSLSSDLKSDASDAKQCLSGLPLNNVQLDNLNKFLSQVGNYSEYIANTAENGKHLTIDEYTNLAELYNYASLLSDELYSMEKNVQNGIVNISKTKNTLIQSKSVTVPQITDNFNAFEENTEASPQLIYDGPFSDHILQKQSQLLKDAYPVKQSEALAKAADFIQLPADHLTPASDENGKMPSYCFSSDNGYISVTKSGGYISYMLKNRTITKMNLTVPDALNNANVFLRNSGYDNLTTTYYQTLDNICTINFAVKTNNIVYYTDLIKVSVAMDNGEIIAFDARGYLMNNKNRPVQNDIITLNEAKESLSPLLKVEQARLSVIPTNGQNEILCYEFLCTSRNDQQVLVYINALTKAEENILILYIQGDSVLTM